MCQCVYTKQISNNFCIYTLTLLTHQIHSPLGGSRFAGAGRKPHSQCPVYFTVSWVYFAVSWSIYSIHSLLNADIRMNVPLTLVTNNLFSHFVIVNKISLSLSLSLFLDHYREYFWELLPFAASRKGVGRWGDPLRSKRDLLSSKRDLSLLPAKVLAGDDTAGTSKETCFFIFQFFQFAQGAIQKKSLQRRPAPYAPLRSSAFLTAAWRACPRSPAPCHCWSSKELRVPWR